MFIGIGVTRGGIGTILYRTEITMYCTESLVCQIYYHRRTKIFGIQKNLVQYSLV